MNSVSENLEVLPIEIENSELRSQNQLLFEQNKNLQQQISYLCLNIQMQSMNNLQSVYPYLDATKPNDNLTAFEQLKFEIYILKKEMEFTKQMAIDGYTKRSHTEDSFERNTLNLYRQLCYTDLAVVIDTIKPKDERAYNEMVSKLSALCFTKILHVIFPGKKIFTESDINRILDDKYFLENCTLVLGNEVFKIIVQQGFDITEELKNLVKDFCIKCLELAAKMKTFTFISPEEGTVICDYTYDYHKFKPTIKTVLYPGIKTSDGSVLVKARILLEEK
jgi:hypothetical protein